MRERLRGAPQAGKGGANASRLSYPYPTPWSSRYRGGGDHPTPPRAPLTPVPLRVTPFPHPVGPCYPPPLTNPQQTEAELASAAQERLQMRQQLGKAIADAKQLRQRLFTLRDVSISELRRQGQI